jgi:hypothetical protein
MLHCGEVGSGMMLQSARLHSARSGTYCAIPTPSSLQAESGDHPHYVAFKTLATPRFKADMPLRLRRYAVVDFVPSMLSCGWSTV